MKKYYTDVARDRYFLTTSYIASTNGAVHTSEQEFDTYDAAVKAATKTAAKTREDVTIYVTDSVVKFPVDDYKVEKVD